MCAEFVGVEVDEPVGRLQEESAEPEGSVAMEIEGKSRTVQSSSAFLGLHSLRGPRPSMSHAMTA